MHTYLSLHLSVCPSVRPSVRPSIHPSIHLSIHLFTYLPTCLPTYLSVYPCTRRYSLHSLTRMVHEEGVLTFVGGEGFVGGSASSEVDGHVGASLSRMVQGTQSRAVINDDAAVVKTQASPHVIVCGAEPESSASRIYC
ncbi:hypothetical protein TcWFU_000176 [Taenia crassiceps]|uniref:Uncharacterized protein n=1 Tax=Taenia crassiceps TaxID=6207 RepID=A0ABR4QBW2_9CEST